jgi:hypothetical protein
MLLPSRGICIALGAGLGQFKELMPLTLFRFFFKMGYKIRVPLYFVCFADATFFNSLLRVEATKGSGQGHVHELPTYQIWETKQTSPLYESPHLRFSSSHEDRVDTCNWLIDFCWLVGWLAGWFYGEKFCSLVHFDLELQIFPAHLLS